MSVLGKPNKLNLPARRSVLVVLVDGLGSRNLKESGAHAGFLNSQNSIPASCYYPSTTASSLVSFATGKPPWENNFIGYQVYDRSTKTSMNLLSGWTNQDDAKTFQPLETISEQALSAGLEFHSVAPVIYKDSGFTAATMRGATFHGLNTVADRFSKALELLAQPTSKIIYLYVPELDQCAHAFGWKSVKWLNLLEDLDAEVQAVSRALPKNTGMILTADHGVLDIAPGNHIYLDEYLDADKFEFVGGDTRGLFLYLKDQSTTDEISRILESEIGDSSYLVTPEEFIAQGYWRESSKKSLLPDLVVLAKREVALYHRGFAKRKSLEMIGHHGSISNAELAIPLITIGF